MFDSVDTVRDCLHGFAEMMLAVQVNADAMRAAAMQGFATATYYLADYLAAKNAAKKKRLKSAG